MRLEETVVFQHVSELVGVPSLNVTQWELWIPKDIEGDGAFSWETMDAPFWYSWSERLWPLQFIILAFYFYTCFHLKEYMKTRGPLKGAFFHNILALYNIILVVIHLTIVVRAYSFIGRAMKLPRDDWLQYSLCNRMDIGRKEMFWMLCAGWCKYIMLLDTIFLILKKNTVPFFHMYHHTLVAYTAFKIFPLGEPIFFWCGYINMIQLVISYSVLFLKALKLPIFPHSSVFLLLVELLQMITGTYFNLYTLSVLRNGGPCTRHPISLTFMNVAYISLGFLAAKMINDSFKGNKFGERILKDRAVMEQPTSRLMHEICDYSEYEQNPIVRLMHEVCYHNRV